MPERKEAVKSPGNDHEGGFSAITKESFLKDTESHKLQIVKDDGVHRHIVMSKGSSVYRYEITTWPQFLCFSGDMGCFVFCRVEDMFTFFRQTSGELNISKGYWHQKLEAVDKDGGAKKFSPEVFADVVKHHFDLWVDDAEPDAEKKAKVWQEIESDVLWLADDNKVRAFDAANNFTCEGFEFVDFWDNEFEDYTCRFIWCLYAIVYAIQKYDAEVKP